MKPYKNGCLCPECGQRGWIVRPATNERTWTDIAVFELQVILYYAPKEIACRSHGRIQELVRSARPAVAHRFVEFFACRICNRNTRLAYAHAVARFLGDMATRGVRDLARIRPTMVAAYVERLEEELAAPSMKQHLAAIRMLFDWLVITGALIRNPAVTVRGPKFFVTRGKTPVLSAGQDGACAAVAIQGRPCPPRFPPAP